MREALLVKTIALLKESGFAVETFLQSHSCFDIAARRQKLLFAIKVLNNIDALREEQALELRKVAVLFNAIVLVVGEKTKAFFLRDDCVYDRYSVNVLSYAGFAGMLKENFPAAKYFKGKEIVELNSEKMRERRKQLGITLEELAQKIDSTTESIYRYEKGAGISLQKAEAIEGALGASLIKKIDLFGQRQKQAKEDLFEKELEDSALEKIHGFGVQVSIFSHAPFEASASKKETIIIARGKSRQEIKKKAFRLSHAKNVFGSGPVIIAKEFKAKSIAHVPVIEEEELASMSRFNELKELIMERGKQNER